MYIWQKPPDGWMVQSCGQRLKLFNPFDLPLCNAMLKQRIHPLTDTGCSQTHLLWLLDLGVSWKKKKREKNEKNWKETDRPKYRYIHKHKPTHISLPIASFGLWTVWLYSYAHFWGTRAKPEKNESKNNKSRHQLTQRQRWTFQLCFLQRSASKQVPSLWRPTGYHSQTLTKCWHLPHTNT